MATKEVKSEGWGGDSDDDNVPISAINRGKKKKVEDSDDDDDELPLAASRAKKKSADGKKGGGLKGNAVPSKVKKEQSQDSKENMKKKKVKKDNSKGKENSSGNVKKEKVKRVYELPGQKHDPPEERDPLRIFYETLYEQAPNSEMAAFWMMERGLLPEDEAEKVFKKKKQKGILSPSKPASANKSPGSNTTVKRSLDTCSSTKKGKTGTSKDSAAKKSRKRKADSDSEEEDSDDDDDDFVDAPKVNPRKRRKVSN